MPSRRMRWSSFGSTRIWLAYIGRGFQSSCSSTRLRSGGAADSPSAAAASADKRSEGKRPGSAPSGSSPTIFPGLKIFSGSKTRLISRNSGYSGHA